MSTDKATVLERLRAGARSSEVSATMGVDINLVRRWRREAGIPPAPPGPRAGTATGHEAVRAKVRAEVRALHARNLSLRQIARRLGLSHERIRQILAQDPSTPAEWQEAVDLAHFHLVLESARQYGLITVKGGLKVNVARCEELLREGAQRGLRPSPDAIERLISQGGGDG